MLLFFTLLFLTSSCVFSDNPAKAAPPVIISGINPNTVITVNSVTIGAEANIPKEKIKAVEFRIKYLDDFGDNFNPEHHLDKVQGQGLKAGAHYNDLIGIDSTYPYQIFWDLSEIPDQDGRTIQIWPVAILKSGKRLRGPAVKDFVIDRNPEIPDLKYLCKHKETGIKIDGLADDWPELPTITVYAGKDTLLASLLWDKSGLFGIVKVKDDFVYSPTDTMDDGEIRLKPRTSGYWNDCVILSFDPKNNKSPKMDGDDFPLIIVPWGKRYNNGYLRHNEYIINSQDKKIKMANIIHGKMNDNEAKDSGYTIEFFLPAEIFGGLKDQKEIGFDIGFTDRDGPDKLKNTSSWAGLVKRNRSNPTEWGTVILEKQKKAPVYLVILIIILSGSLIYLLKKLSFFRKKVIQGIRPEKKAPEQHPLISETNKILKRELSNPELNINYISAKLGTKPGYLGKLYKNKTGETIIDKINILRIERAETLLKNGKMNVTQASFSVGYNSPQYFIRIFKKIKGHTPKKSAD
ncbi:MAG: helix-turn-helix domain-containing protein [Fibrobacterota bacterium]